MKKTQRTLGKRLVCILLALSSSGSLLPFVTSQSNVQAADYGDDALTLFNLTENGVSTGDTINNPLGKKRNTISGTNEVMISAMGSTQGVTLGADHTIGQFYSSLNDMVFYDHTSYFTEAGTDVMTKKRNYISSIEVCELEDEPSGDEYINQDMNEQAKGAYIYLKPDYTTNPLNAITGLLLVTIDDVNAVYVPPKEIVTGGKKYHPCDYKGLTDDDGFERSYGDLNFGAGGKYVLLYYTKDCDAVNKDGSAHSFYALRSLDFDTKKYDGDNTNSIPGMNVEIILDDDGEEAEKYEYSELSTVSLNEGTTKPHDFYMHFWGDYVTNYDEVEGTAQIVSNAFQNEPWINKTAAGKFSGDETGQQTQYAIAAYDKEQNRIKLAVCDAKTEPKKTGYITLGGINPDVTAGCSNAEKELIQAAYLSIVTGDFNNNGMDEIAVYNPDYTDGASYESRVEIYAPTGTSEDNIYNISNLEEYDIETKQKKTGAWKLITTIPVEKDAVVSLSAGDADRDGFEDLVISTSEGTNVYFGHAVSVLEDTLHPLTLKKEAGSNKEENADISRPINPSATVFTDKNDKTYIAVLGQKADKSKQGVLNLFSCERKADSNAAQKIRTSKFHQSVEVTMHGYYTDLWYRDGAAPQKELHCLNGVLSSPAFKGMYTCSNGILTEHPYDDAEAKRAECMKGNHLVYDVQLANLIPNSEIQTAFYKIIDYDEEEEEMRYYHGAYTAGILDNTVLMPPQMYFRGTENQKVPSCYVIADIDEDSAVMTYTGTHRFEYTEPRILAVLSSPPYFKDVLEKTDLSGGYSGSSTGFNQMNGSSSGFRQSTSVTAGIYAKYDFDVNLAGWEIGGYEAEMSKKLGFTHEYSETEAMQFGMGSSTSAGEDMVVLYVVPQECFEYTITETHNGKPRSVTRTLCLPKQPGTTTISLTRYHELCKQYSTLPEIGDDVLNHTLGEPDSYPSTTAGYHDCVVYDGDYGNVGYSGSMDGSGNDQSISFSSEIGKVYSGSAELSYSGGVKIGYGSMGLSLEVTEETGKVTTNMSEQTFTASMKNLPEEVADYGYGMTWKLFVHKNSYKNEYGDEIVFPVVDYLVNNVTQPPHAPQNLRQNYEASTQDSIALEWEYPVNENISSFSVYRMMKEGSQSFQFKIGTVSKSDCTGLDAKTNLFKFTDTGADEDGNAIKLVPDKIYTYYIEANRPVGIMTQKSLTAELPEASVLPAGEYPEIEIEGVRDGVITMYPDLECIAKAAIKNAAVFSALKYKWQRFDTKDRTWKDIKDCDTKTIRLDEIDSYSSVTADGDANQYRCCVDAFSRGWIEACSEPFTISKVQRVTEAVSFTAGSKEDESISGLLVNEEGNSITKLFANVVLKGSEADCSIIPSGSVKFRLMRQGEICREYITTLTANADKTATAELQAEEHYEEFDGSMIPNADNETTARNPLYQKPLENGIYQLVACYEGTSSFSPCETAPIDILIGKERIYPVISRVNGTQEENTDTFCYGDSMKIRFCQFNRNENGTLIKTPTSVPEKIMKIGKEDKPGYHTRTLEHEGSLYSYSYYVAQFNIPLTVKNLKLYLGELSDKANQPTPDAANLNELPFFEEQTLQAADIAQLHYYDMNDSEVALHDRMTPGIYKMTVQAIGEYAPWLNFTLSESFITVEPIRFDVKITADLCNGEPAGTISMMLPEQINGITNQIMRYGSGTPLILTAVPNPGFCLEKWECDNLTSKLSKSNPNVFSSNTISSDTEIHAVFKQVSSTVAVENPTVNGGIVICPKGYSTNHSYSIGTELIFKMQPDTDYLADHWVKQVYNGDTEQIAGDVINITITDKPIILTPVFVGKPCTLNLSSELQAEFIYAAMETQPENKIIASGSTVPKCSKIAVRVCDDIKLTGNEYLLCNGSEIELTDGYYEMEIAGDTDIQLMNFETPTTVMTETTQSAISGTTTESTSVSSVTAQKTGTTESSASSKTTESSASSQTTKPSVSSLTTESSVSSQATEPSLSSLTTESSASSNTTEYSATEPTGTTVIASMTTTETSSLQTAETTSAISSAETTGTSSYTTTATETTTVKTAGDLNGDGNINLKDVVLLRRHIAGGWNVTLEMSVVDLNGDGNINLKDVVLLRRYIAGGWDVKLPKYQ